MKIRDIGIKYLGIGISKSIKLTYLEFDYELNRDVLNIKL